MAEQDPASGKPANPGQNKPKDEQVLDAFELQSIVDQESPGFSIKLDMTPVREQPKAAPTAKPASSDDDPATSHKPGTNPAPRPAGASGRDPQARAAPTPKPTGTPSGTGRAPASAPPKVRTQPPPLPADPAPPVVVPVVPEWKVIEPADQTEPVPHEMFELRPRDATWNIMAASLRGRLHAHKGSWREDAYAFEWIHDWTIVALSDGAGSARLARIGSRVACEEAIKSVGPALAKFRMTHGNEEMPSVEDQRRLREILAKGAHDARAGVMLEAGKRGCNHRDLNATFLLMIHTPFKDDTLVGAIQIGDGAIGIFTEDDACHVLGVADHGSYSSETRFLTDAGIDTQFGQRVMFSFFKRKVRGLAVMCDGVSDDFFPEAKRLIELFNGNPIQELKTKTSESVFGLMHKDKGVTKNPQDGKALLDWLRYEKRGSSDDRTLVLMYRK